MPDEHHKHKYSGRISAFNTKDTLLTDKIKALQAAGGSFERGIMVLLISNPRDSGAAKDIYPKLPYINYRSGEHLEFLVTGLVHENDRMFFSPKELIEVFTLEDGKYYFSDKAFVELITHLESITSWEYQGGSEIIVVDYKINAQAGQLNWGNAFLIDIDEALKKKAIFSVSKFMESLIRIVKNEESSTAFTHALTILEQQGKKSLYSIVLSFFPKKYVDELKKIELFVPRDLKRR